MRKLGNTSIVKMLHPASKKGRSGFKRNIFSIGPAKYYGQNLSLYVDVKNPGFCFSEILQLNFQFCMKTKSMKIYRRVGTLKKVICIFVFPNGAAWQLADDRSTKRLALKHPYKEREPTFLLAASILRQ